MLNRKLSGHPLMTMRFLKRYIYILIIPVVRGLLNWGAKGMLTQFLIAELILLLFLTVFAVLSWRSYSLTLFEGVIELGSGVIFTSKSRIPVKKCAGIFIEHKPLLSLFGGVAVRLDTESGSSGKADYEVILRKRDTEVLIKHLQPAGIIQVKYKSTIKNSLLMAISTSSAITGMIVSIPVINGVSSFLGDDLIERLYEAVYGVAALLEIILPPFIGVIALLFLLGFVISFIVSLIRHAHFSVSRYEGGLMIKGGAVIRRDVYFSEPEVNMVQFEQTPLANLIRRFSVKVCVAGYGKESKESAVLIPCDTLSACSKTIAELLPDFRLESLYLKLPRYAIRRTLFTPLILIACVLLLGIFGAYHLPMFRRLILVITVSLLFLILIHLFVRIRTYRVGGLTFGPQVEAAAGKFFSSYRLKTGQDRVGVIRVQRTPFDIPENFCSVRITVRSKKAMSLTVPNLDYDQVLAYIRKIYF